MAQKRKFTWKVDVNQDWIHWGQVFCDPQDVSSYLWDDFMVPGSPSGRQNSPRLAALLPSGKWNFDPAKSTVKTLIQYDWEAILAPAVWKCFWLKQPLSCLSISPEGGRRLCERVGQTVILKGEWLPQSSREWEKGSSSPSVQIRIQKCSSFSLSFVFPFF